MQLLLLTAISATIGRWQLDNNFKDDFNRNSLSDTFVGDIDAICGTSLKLEHDQYKLISRSPNAFPKGAETFAMGIRTKILSSGDRVLLHLGDDNLQQSYNGVAIRISAFREVQFITYGPGLGLQGTSTYLDLGKWYQIMIAYQSGRMFVYVDGFSVANLPFTLNLLWGSSNSGFIIGGRNTDVGTNLGRDGVYLVDECEIHDTHVVLTGVVCLTIPATLVPIPPTAVPTLVPTAVPTAVPTLIPTVAPTVVPTIVPPTQIPSTSSPLIVTSVPGSSSPSLDTAIPVVAVTGAPNTSTSEPVNSVQTSEPEAVVLVTNTPTAIPGTSVPEVGVHRDTQVPKTLVPDMPFGVIDSKDTVDTTATVTAAAAVVGVGLAAGSATSLIATSSGCAVEGSTGFKFPSLFHPVGWKVSGSVPLGVIIGNYLIITTLTLLSVLSVHIIRKFGIPCSKSLITGLDTQGFIRFPSFPLFIFQFLYQGTVIASALLIFYGEGPFQVLTGAISMSICSAVPFIVLKRISTDVPSQALYRDDTRRGKWLKLLIGSGEWVSRYEHTHWVLRWKVAIKPYKQSIPWYIIVEYLTSLTLGVITSLKVKNSPQCGYLKISSAIIFGTAVIFSIIMKPYVRMRDLIFSVIFYLLQVVSMLCMAYGYILKNPGHQSFQVASRCTLLAVIVLLVNVVIDSLGEIYIFFSGSFTDIQKQQWSATSLQDASIADDTLFLPVGDTPIVNSHRESDDKPTISNPNLLPLTLLSPSVGSLLKCDKSNASVTSFSEELY